MKRGVAKPGTRKPTSGVCRVCGCTDEWACEGGCGWVDAAQTLCSSLLCSLADLLRKGAAGPFEGGAKWQAEAVALLRRVRKEHRR